MSKHLKIGIYQWRDGTWTYPDMGWGQPLTYDECLLAAIKRAQDLGYDSFSITSHPHPDYEEEEAEDEGNTPILSINYDLDPISENPTTTWSGERNADFGEPEKEQPDTYHDSQHRVLTNRITDLEKVVHALQERVKWESNKASDLFTNHYTCIGELQDADRHLDKTIDAVSQRVDDLAIYRRNHLEYILPDLEARIRDLERSR